MNVNCSSGWECGAACSPFAKRILTTSMFSLRRTLPRPCEYLSETRFASVSSNVTLPIGPPPVRDCPGTPYFGNGATARTHPGGPGCIFDCHRMPVDADGGSVSTSHD